MWVKICLLLEFNCLYDEMTMQKCYYNVQVVGEKFFYRFLHHLYHEVPDNFHSHDVSDVGNQSVSKTEYAMQ